MDMSTEKTIVLDVLHYGKNVVGPYGQQAGTRLRYDVPFSLRTMSDWGYAQLSGQGARVRRTNPEPRLVLRRLLDTVPKGSMAGARAHHGPHTKRMRTLFFFRDELSKGSPLARQ